MNNHRTNSLRVFVSYSHVDEDMKKELEKYLIQLIRSNKISAWNDRKLMAGDRLDNTILFELSNADIIIMLLSQDFIASYYCYEKELAIALERETKGLAKVIPVILRKCDWKNTPLKDLVALPTDGKHVLSWEDKDEAYFNIKVGIEEVVNKLIVNP
jgi:hypothetical protein